MHTVTTTEWMNISEQEDIMNLKGISCNFTMTNVNAQNNAIRWTHTI